MSTATAQHPDILSKEDEEYYRQQWQTPDALFRWITEQVKQFGIYGFGIDVAAEAHNKKCYYYICPPSSDAFTNDMSCKGRDALLVSWEARWGEEHSAKEPYKSAAWCNPPFKQAGKFLTKAYEEVKKGVFSVCLTQADTSVKWCREAERHATARIEIEGRVQFKQHPKILAHMKAKGIKPSGNPGGNYVWIFNPYDIDRPGECRIVRCGPWKEAR